MKVMVYFVAMVARSQLIVAVHMLSLVHLMKQRYCTRDLEEHALAPNVTDIVSVQRER